jgi:hypothetical protein
MMQCSSGGAQIQYSRRRIFFGFEDEIQGAGACPRVTREQSSVREQVTSGYHDDLYAINQYIMEQEKLSAMSVAALCGQKRIVRAATHCISAAPK